MATKIFESASGVVDLGVDKVALALSYSQNNKLEDYLVNLQYTDKDDRYGIEGGKKSYNAGKQIYKILSQVFTDEELSEICSCLNEI